MSISVLHQYAQKDNNVSINSKLLSDLSVLVTEIEIGAFVQRGEPNYALFCGVVKSIRALLDVVISGKLLRTPLGQDSESNPLDGTGDEVWSMWNHMEPWEFEIEFWNNLIEHLTTVDPQIYQ